MFLTQSPECLDYRPMYIGLAGGFRSRQTDHRSVPEQVPWECLQSLEATAAFWHAELAAVQDGFPELPVAIEGSWPYATATLPCLASQQTVHLEENKNSDCFSSRQNISRGGSVKLQLPPHIWEILDIGQQASWSPSVTLYEFIHSQTALGML